MMFFSIFEFLIHSVCDHLVVTASAMSATAVEAAAANARMTARRKASCVPAVIKAAEPAREALGEERLEIGEREPKQLYA